MTRGRIANGSLLAGFGAIGYGLWLAWPPLAWLFGGAVLFGVGVLLVWNKEPDR